MKTLPRLFLIVLSAVGCGSDARTSRLTAGSSAKAHGRDGKPVPVFFSGSTELLPVDTLVKVVADAEDKPSEPQRKVVVSIQSGPSQGLAGQMYRSDLYPDD